MSGPLAPAFFPGASDVWRRLTDARRDSGPDERAAQRLPPATTRKFRNIMSDVGRKILKPKPETAAPSANIQPTRDTGHGLERNEKWTKYFYKDEFVFTE
jgi:hypothetical protein